MSYNPLMLDNRYKFNRLSLAPHRAARYRAQSMAIVAAGSPSRASHRGARRMASVLSGRCVPGAHGVAPEARRPALRAGDKAEALPPSPKKC